MVPYPKPNTGAGGAAHGLSRSGSLPTLAVSSEMRRTRTGPSPLEIATRPNTIPKAGHGRSRQVGSNSLSKRPPSGGLRPPSAGRRTPSTASRPGSAKHQKLNDQSVRSKPPSLLSFREQSDDGAGEVHVFGDWTAHEDPELGLVFVHIASGQVQTDVPPEVLAYIQEEEHAANDDQEANQSQSNAKYERIFMSTNKNVPQLLMAKDMVAALRQGTTPFAAIRQHFSDAREEGLLSARNCGSQELQACAKSLRVGQVSDPVVDKAGVHILLRVS